jgi:hypothetical protein
LLRSQAFGVEATVDASGKAPQIAIKLTERD